jgi:hypothetical protein
MTVTEKRLRIFVDYLKGSTEIIDSYSGDGKMESAIKYAKQEVKNEIGDMLEEILDISEEEILDHAIKQAKNIAQKLLI